MATNWQKGACCQHKFLSKLISTLYVIYLYFKNYGKVNTMKYKSAFLLFSSMVVLTACNSNKRNPIQEIHQGYSETAEQYEVDGKIISNVDSKAWLWNPRGKSLEQIVERATYLASKYDLERTEEQIQRANQAREKYADAIVINSVIPSAVGIIGNTEEHYEKGLKRNFDAGMTLASTTVYAFPGDGDMPILERMAKSTAVVHNLGYELVENTQTIRQCKHDHNMAIMLNSQGADYAIGDMGMVEKVAEKGLKAANFTYNRNNDLAGGGTKQDMGLTKMGIDFVKQCNANGIIVDVSHSSNQTAIEAAKYSTKPIIASHSNAYALHQIGRNMSDSAIIAVGNTGGVVATTGVGLFLNPEGDASPEAYAKHVVYTAKLIGRDKTGFSTDYVHNILDYYIGFVPNVDVYPPESGFGAPIANIAPENVWDVVAVLEDSYGWSEQDIRGFLGENLMRVYKANWE
jgi:microsomal dipeptidase-like Zn-dependent dipeptidase